MRQDLSLSNQPKKNGRPPKPLDFQKLEKLLELYPTKKYLATFFDCSEQHIDNEIARHYDMGFLALRERAIEGKKSDVMNWAFKYASLGNDRLITFLMKNLHKWTDKIEIEASEQQVFELKYAIEKRQKNLGDVIEVEARQIEQGKPTAVEGDAGAKEKKD